VLAGQYKKEFLRGRSVAGDFLRAPEWRVMDTIVDDAE
jgi:hypothetical protein